MLFLTREGGQGLTEYALLIAFVALIVIFIVGVLGQQLLELYELITTCLPDPQDPMCFP
jgi:Flp pilus assembly pilin Flp